MRHHIRAVLFDLDGVVADTAPYQFGAWKRLADEQGWTLSERMADTLNGRPRAECLDTILTLNTVTASAGDRHAFASRKNAYLVDLLCDIGESDLRPGVIAFLGELKKRGVKLGLYSLSSSAAVVAERLELNRWFDVVVTGSDERYANWSAGIFEECANRLHVPAFHCLAMESSASGVKAALDAGVKVVGTGDSAQHAGAREIVTGFADVNVDFLLDSGRTSKFPEEPWHVTETTPRPGRSRYWETLFALSNGLLGMRGSHEEEDPVIGKHSYPGMFVNGVYGYQPYRHVASFPGFPDRLHVMLNLVDWRVINLTVDGDRFSLFSGVVSDYRRTLDLQRGVVERSVVWQSPSGSRVRMKTTRLVSMVRRHCAAIRYEVTALEKPVTVQIETRVYGSVASEELGPNQTRVEDAVVDTSSVALLVRSTTSPFDVGAAVVESLSGVDMDPGVRTQPDDDTYVRTASGEILPDSTLVLEKYAAFHSTIETPAEQVLDAARTSAGAAASDGFEALLSEQTAFWAGYWDLADIEIGGCVSDQQALRFSLFHLRQSNPEDDYRSIGANGMTGDKYRGHVFWDTEMYMVPAFLYSEPAVVRPLLMYRYNLLDRARERARQMGGVGALFSWNSISGEECGVVFEASTAEYHLVSAVASAIARYHDATGDDGFLHDYGAEVVFETARFLEDRGCFVAHKGGQFCINVVCGPDEYGCGVNNNCYTNMMAQWHLAYAADLYERMRQDAPDSLKALASRIGLSRDEPGAWRMASEKMYIPFNEGLGIHEQDDSFLSLDPVDMSMVPRNTDIREIMHPLNLWRMQVAKQADVVLLMFVLGHRFSADVKKANYEFYEPRTCHGSSLSACIHAIVAAEIGRHEDAYDYLRESVMMDLNDFKNNTGGGVHSACLGGTWMAVVNGMAGMRDYPDGLRFNPMLPHAWKRYRFKVRYRGALLEVVVDETNTTLRLLEGDSVTCMVGDSTVDVSAADGTSVPR